MDSTGLILVTDHVCSMKRDRVNFEDRILNDVRSMGVSNSIVVRRFECSDTADALRTIRKNDIYISKIRSKTDYCRAYVLIGNTEKNTGGNRFWFSQYIRSIYEEFNLLNIDMCFVFTELRDGYKLSKEIHQEYKSKNIEYYNVKTNTSWQDVSQKEFKNFCKDFSVDFVQSVLNCPKFWDTPTKDSIKNLSTVIASDFINYGEL